ncbi:HEM14 [Candida theae]|uniref:Protoporphyrinogen oxidase n=1 Tax=Candida theae TaxID=1198502 RepID=A0AAD5G0J2_9ASCO|nr:HEM14 [Candida theae]KAI5965464.1 HEM14 [Candida theae]
MSLQPLPKNATVAMLGAGISGLTFTYFLSKLRPDLSFQIFEKSNRPGGWMCSPRLLVSDSHESIILEKGPRTLRGVKNGSLFMIDILRNLNLHDEVEVIHKSSKANRKYITDAQGEIVQVPNSFTTAVDFFKRVQCLDGSLISGLIKEPFVKSSSHDETVEQFFRRRFGSTVLTENVASAIIHGVYAGDIGKLSIKSVMPFLKDIETQSGSVIKHVFKSMIKSKKPNKSPPSVELELYEKLISPQANLPTLQSNLKSFPMIKLKNGMETLPKYLAQYLEYNTNTEIHYDTPVNECDPKLGQVNGQSFDHIRSTINTHSLAQSIQSSDSLVSKLKGVSYVSIFLTNVYTKKPILLPKDKPGFGFLRPRHLSIENNAQALLGVIYDSDIENHVQSLFNKEKTTPSGEYNKITMMMGGHYYNHWNIPSNKLNLKIVLDVLQEKLNVDVSKYNLKIIEEGQELQVDSIGDDDIVVSCSLHRDCIPQYNLGYQELKQDVLDLVEKEHYKLSFGGTVFAEGIGVPDCVSNSFTDAVKLM